MNKVYLLRNYERAEIIIVFSTMEKANEYMSKLKDSQDYSIDEHIVDEKSANNLITYYVSYINYDKLSYHINEYVIDKDEYLGNNTEHVIRSSDREECEKLSKNKLDNYIKRQSLLSPNDFIQKFKDSLEGKLVKISNKLIDNIKFGKVIYDDLLITQDKQNAVLNVVKDRFKNDEEILYNDLIFVGLDFKFILEVYNSGVIKCIIQQK